MRNLKFLLNLVYLIGALGAVTAFSAGGGVASDQRTSDSPAALRDCLATCSSLPCLTSAEHQNMTGGPGGYGLGRHGCIAELDCAYHACAVTGVPSTLELERLLEDSNLDELLRIVPARNLAYVAERGVVQLLADCGSVIAQLPATPSAAAALGSD